MKAIEFKFVLDLCKVMEELTGHGNKCITAKELNKNALPVNA